jgi:glutamyl-tRNA synthetase
MNKPVRVRFAPSPTGPLHIGGVRTALFNYLFAKKHQGTFFLRIEDTDQNRFEAGAEAYIFKALDWLGISPDETVGKNEKFGPYRQSERQAIYRAYAKQLIENGWAYYAFDSADSLDFHRKDHEVKGKTFIYNWHNREKLNNSLTISADELKHRLTQGDDYVIRFKTPTNETLILNDIIRGEIKIDTNLLDDKILFKSDGMPTYHLANIVDDHLMETTHVIRGEEWLPSLALHVLLYRAFGWDAPQFAHLPLILKPEGNGKLSKRDGDKFGFPIFPLNWQSEEGLSLGYKESGYFPEAVVNFLALLGWNDGTDQEIYSLEELIEKFDLTHVHKAGAKFDYKKNTWFNHQYLQTKSNKELAAVFTNDLNARGISSNLDVEKIIALTKDRANFSTDFWDLTQYFFEAPKHFDEAAIKKFDTSTYDLLSKSSLIISEISVFESVIIEQTIKEWLNKQQIGIGKLMQPLRIALVGALKGPHLFDVMEIIGKKECLERIYYICNQ